MSNLIQKLFSDVVPPKDTTYVEVAGVQNAPAVEGNRPSEYRQHLEVQSYLPLAAEKYGISKNIKDYVIVPVIILPTDIPNRNSVAFPYEELMKFNVSQGRPNYKTWAGKPTFIEHENADYTAAKGIVFDTYMKPLEHAEGNIYKLIALCGFDRSKDYELARQILSGDRKSYSMGAFISQYECSVCGMHSRPGKMNTECGHVIRGKPEIYTHSSGAKIPSYLIARQEITGFEVSSVGVPAWSSATNSNLFDMRSY